MTVNQHGQEPHFRRRRRSSTASSLVGSYEESLLSGRMSASTSPPVEFLAKVSVQPTTASLRSYKSLSNLSFDASFFHWGEQVTGKQESSPYVGVLDMPPQDGYRIPHAGQLQIVVFNTQRTPVQFLTCQYDLSDMAPGYKTIVRCKKYAAEEVSKRLCQALQFQVVSVASNLPKPSTTRRSPKPKLYIRGPIRLVFPNRVREDAPAGKLANVRSETCHVGYMPL